MSGEKYFWPARFQLTVVEQYRINSYYITLQREKYSIKQKAIQVAPKPLLLIYLVGRLSSLLLFFFHSIMQQFFH
jgi:hypothetical protein